jgi:hypothetical protein
MFLLINRIKFISKLRYLLQRGKCLIKLKLFLIYYIKYEYNKFFYLI